MISLHKPDAVQPDRYMTNIHEKEKNVKGSNKTIEGQQLTNILRDEASKRGMTVREIAELLGISHVHLSSLINGARKISGLNPQKQRKLAKFLRISMVDFFLMCGVLRQEDFDSGAPVQ